MRCLNFYFKNSKQYFTIFYTNLLERILLIPTEDVHFKNLQLHTKNEDSGY